MFKKSLKLIMCLAGIFLFSAGAVYAGPCADDVMPPEILITSPTSGGSYTTTSSELSLEGEVSDGTAVAGMSWFNDRGGEGGAVGSTDWTGTWRWEIQGISLQEGENEITVTALDANGNQATEVIVVSYNPASPPPLPSDQENLENRKAKFIFYFGESGYDGIDQFSIVSYLENDPDQPFEIPIDKDVIVTVSVVDPADYSQRIQVFQQVIPAGSAPVSSKYTWSGNGTPIKKIILQRTTSTRTYMYLYVAKVDFLPERKSGMSPEDYHNYVRGIPGYQLRVQVEDRSWQGEGPLTIWASTAHKQELVHNR